MGEVVWALNLRDTQTGTLGALASPQHWQLSTLAWEKSLFAVPNFEGHLVS